MNKKRNGLFRSEAITRQSARLEGTMCIAQPINANILFYSLTLAIVTTTIFLSFAEFQRKETVTGYISPQTGLTKIVSPRTALIQKVLINDGEQVFKGDPLVMLRLSSGFRNSLTNNQSSYRQLTANIDQQLAFIEARRSNYTQELFHRLNSIDESLEFGKQSLDDIVAQVVLAEEKLELKRDSLNDLVQLKSSGLVTKQDIRLQEEYIIELKQEISRLKVSQRQQASEISHLVTQKVNLPVEYEQRDALLNVEKKQLERQRTQLTGESEILITAPRDGLVTNLHLVEGASVRESQSLLTLIPQDEPLKAILLIPSSAFGFVKPGQKTKLRFDAFPYQRFGLFSGEITETSKYIIAPGEVDMPVSMKVHAYTAEVALTQQAVHAYGQNAPLRPGMTLSADIVLEERSLLSWLFEPIFSISGRI